MRFLSGLCLAAAGLAAVPAVAEQGSASSFPALFDVTGVTARDVLNLREEPSAGAGVAGSLAADATGIEVVRLSPDGKWGRVSRGEGAAWVSMRYLARQPAAGWETLGQPLRCLGTEPFWAFDLDTPAGQIRLSRPGQSDPLPLAIDWSRFGSGAGGFAGLSLSDGQGGTGFASLTGAACSDGMSDREFSISVRLFLNLQDPDSTGRSGYFGCCTLVR